MRFAPLLMCSAALGAASAAQAETVVFYDFNTPAGLFEASAEQASPNVASTTTWFAASGDAFNLSGGTDNRAIAAGACAVGDCVTPSLWGPTQSLGFDFTVAPGMKLDLTQVSFRERFGGAGTGGPVGVFAGWNLLVNGVEVASGATDVDSAFDAWIETLNATALTGTVNVRFTGDAPFNTTGNWRVDDFVLTGNFVPVPLPGAAGLLGSALLGLVGVRRCRR